MFEKPSDQARDFYAEFREIVMHNYPLERICLMEAGADRMMADLDFANFAEEVEEDFFGDDEGGLGLIPFDFEDHDDDWDFREPPEFSW